MPSDALLVVAAIIRHPDDGSILLSQRPAHKHQGGRWEFPGGKVEPGETLDAALARELEEELGLRVTACRPFMTIEHDYPELSVRLCFREVTAFTGVPHGREGQPVHWFAPSQLAELTFPEANRPVVSALALPDRLLILPDPLPPAWPQQLASALASGIELVYLRGITDEPLLRRLVAACHAGGARALVADSVPLAQAVGADGVHLRSQTGMRLDHRPDSPLVSMACHNAAELAHAEQLGVDLALLSPVLPTPTHPDAPALGWDALRQLAEGRACAVYALGGVGANDLDTARQHGARGIAGIRAFWPSE
ncbi:Nudix family hydrolase [Alcanivorax sp. JB21]|uniref:Nudix family hydrolase n=1 Tax=Alcanivorax limicola TaxID=2874102 RepID=UPI001CBD0E67|nr:Nudix family hydrolase [Alcanivorax limicola]MBZ2189673.1 Nudix family hydrolase [Alcanivorax limicola]